MPSSTFKLAFIVEGDTDRVVVETLARQVWSAPPKIHTVRLGGKAAVPWVWSTVLALLDEKNYDHVVILLDADSTSPDDVEVQRAAIRAQLRQHHFGEEEVSIAFAVPELEAWLIADRAKEPERDSRARFEALFGGRTPEIIEQRARALNLDVARERSPSLDEFMRTLDALRHRVDKAA